VFRRVIIERSMRATHLLLVPAALVALLSCRDPDAPRPVSVLSTPSPEGGEARPLSSRDKAGSDVRPVAPTPRAAPALAPGVPDPAEPGISNLARLARYVFREMRLAQDACPFANPLEEPISFAFHIDVQGGGVAEAHLAWAGARHGEEIHQIEPPPELTAYAECLQPRLEAVVMAPAPEDGVYRPEYSYPGRPGGR
jgi:hypothetical protein